MKKRIFVCSTLACFMLLLSGAPVYAYLDPGTGSAILQGVLAAAAAAAVALKLYWHRLLRVLGLKKSKPVNGDVNSQSPEERTQEDSK